MTIVDKRKKIMRDKMRTSFEAKNEKRRAVDAAEKSGQVADSMDVRKKLMEQLHSGEKTLAEIQKELATIKRNAKKNGMSTRNQIWNKS
jgi:hypothetical protein